LIQAAPDLQSVCCTAYRRADVFTADFIDQRRCDCRVDQALRHLGRTPCATCRALTAARRGFCAVWRRCRNLGARTGRLATFGYVDLSQSIDGLSCPALARAARCGPCQRSWHPGQWLRNTGGGSWGGLRRLIVIDMRPPERARLHAMPCCIVPVMFDPTRQPATVSCGTMSGATTPVVPRTELSATPRAVNLEMM